MTPEAHPEEEITGKAFDRRLMSRLLGYLAPHRVSVILATLVLLLTSALELVGPWLTQMAIDEAIPARDYDRLLILTLAFFGALAGALLFTWFQTWIMQRVGQLVMYDMRRKIFSHQMGMSSAWFDRNPVGRMLTRLTTDVDVLNEMLTSGVVALFGDLVTLFGILGIMFWLDWRLTLATLVVMPLLVLVTAWFRRGVRETYRLVRTRIARINTFLQENITGMSVVQIFGREAHRNRHFDRLNADHLDAHIQSIFYYAVFYPLVELISAIALALVLWYGGIRLLGASSDAAPLTLGVLVAFIQYVRRFYRPIMDLSEKYNILQSAMASAERIFRLLDTEDRIPAPEPPAAWEGFHESIEFRNVWFAYKGEDWILRDVSFTVRHGETVALVGATGSGKTTIISLLCRFYDIRKGSILIDGHDIRTLDLQKLRRSIGLVQQDIFLFSGTIADNVRLGDNDITVEAVAEAVRHVNAAGFIEAIPGGLQARLGERGASLSTGQKQLLAFARALAHRPSLLVLDEATSSVDTETEQLIQVALHRLLTGRTSIVIAHRLSTIQDADRIMVLHRGQLREQGSHRELLRQGGLYFKLYQLQYKDQEIGTRSEA
ncbi:MAG: ABC transporter ATP-binding protein [Candidatus Eisenbacteria bacterium]|nr:ABC transporter ATP-binding protein [Candidatus Eisenbacteria bacterium]